MMKINSSHNFQSNNVIRITFLILCSFFISENTCSQNHWGRDYMWLSRNVVENYIIITFEFFDRHFGQFHEHGYLEYCNFEYSTDGKLFRSLAKCEVNDQELDELLWVKMINKEPDTKIQFYGCEIPAEYTAWNEGVEQWVAVRKFNNKGFLVLLWYVPSHVKIKNIRISGKWTVGGLNCPDYINNEVYEVPYISE